MYVCGRGSKVSLEHVTRADCIVSFNSRLLLDRRLLISHPREFGSVCLGSGCSDACAICWRNSESVFSCSCGPNTWKKLTAPSLLTFRVKFEWAANVDHLLMLGSNRTAVSWGSWERWTTLVFSWGRSLSLTQASGSLCTSERKGI